MAGKQAQILTQRQIRLALNHIKKKHRHKIRDQLIFLLSAKAGLRAGEIAQLKWSMILDSFGNVAKYIAVQDCIAKKCSGRTIPMHESIMSLLKTLKSKIQTSKEKNVLDRSIVDKAIILSERNDSMTSNSIVNWFAVLYKKLNFQGCSSHSGRRTFVTSCARLIHKAGGSLRDVQQLAGHRSIEMTQKYIEGYAPAKLRLMSLI